MEEQGRHANRYIRWAAAFVAVTVMAGVWLRVGMLRPEKLAGFAFGDLVHAHSHVAFFGWVTMAAFAVILRASGSGVPGWFRWHAHLMGIASAAAFLGFLSGGYSPTTIALSALHVTLWVAFAVGIRSTLARGRDAEHAFFRAALVFLMIAGAGTIGTGILSARATDSWTSRLAIELFLTPFIAGWLVLGAFGVAYMSLSGFRHARLVLVLTAVGALPSGLLHIAAPPPLPWLIPLGRAGTLLIGAATLVFAMEVLRAQHEISPFLRLAGGAAMIKGLAEMLVGLGLADHLVGSQPLVIAYLHLVLLGMVTSILADALLAPARVAMPAGLHTVGMALQLGALGTLGWGPLFRVSVALGWETNRLLALALLGGVFSAIAFLIVSARILFRGPVRTRGAVRTVSVSKA